MRWPVVEMNTSSFSTKLATALLAVLLGASLAPAVPITITPGNPGNAGTDNVLFNDSSLVHSGTLVQGNFAGPSTSIVDFTSASGNNMIEGSGGQAMITGLEGNDPFLSLTFALENGETFTKAILNPDATNSSPSFSTIDFVVNYVDAAGSPFMQSFSLDPNGQNFFGILAGDGAKITSVTFSTSNASFDNAAQFRIGGIESSTRVPDGGSTALLIGGSLIGLALLKRRLTAL
jgi:hypothetical protein